MEYTPQQILSINYYFGNQFYLLTTEDLTFEVNNATDPISRFDAINKRNEYNYKHDKHKLEYIKKLEKEIRSIE
jgi:hypothetical protein